MTIDTSATDFFLPPDLVARSLASLAEQCHDELDRLSRQKEQGDPSVKEETRYRLRDYRALIKASFEWGRGIRPVPTPTGGWLVPSRTTSGVVYEVSKPNGYWQCGPNCKATGPHWHTMLALAIEHAIEMTDTEDDGDAEPYDAYAEYEPEAEACDEPFLPDAGAILGRRLARARAAAMETNTELFAA